MIIIIIVVNWFQVFLERESNGRVQIHGKRSFGNKME